MLAEALACAALTMNAPVPDALPNMTTRPEAWFDQRFQRRGVTGTFHYPNTIIILNPADKGILAHEACHFLQWIRGVEKHGRLRAWREYNEPECQRVQVQCQR